MERLGPEDFDGDLLRRPGTWAVAFLADWCPFSREFAPNFAGLEHSGFDLAEADVTSNESPLWERFRIKVVPSVIVFRDGSAVFRADGEPMVGLGPDELWAIRAAARHSTEISG